MVVNNTGDFYTVAQAAKRVESSPARIYNAYHENRLPGGLGWKFLDDWDGELGDVTTGYQRT